ncbi:MAG: hypothetical protein JNM65_01595 [Verrucomicrobiaceae bacterium]|nr:hypothetical protein [Verrucomicrobiaceae bacterium]
MTIRTTVAFDPATVARWERLTKRWGVSKSETLRRALEAAEASPVPPHPTPSPGDKAVPPQPHEISRMSPAQALAWLQSHSLVTAAEGERWRQELRQTREDFATRP